MAYLLDADVFIRAKNFNSRLDFYLWLPDHAASGSDGTAERRTGCPIQTATASAQPGIQQG